MIELDGATGEGGGQILRSALALSMATGEAFRMTNIRARRPNPGLMRQHLTCVLAAQQICGAEVNGASIGSAILRFAPGPVRSGAYHFPIGTAGGTMLVLQAILPALLRAEGPSSVVVEGGTHNRAAPTFEFFERTLLPVLARAGVGLSARLERHGFYPVGGGRVRIEVRPPTVEALRRVELCERGELRSRRATAIVSRIPGGIGEREVEALRDRLGLSDEELGVRDVRDASGQGNALLAEYGFDHVHSVFSVIGERGKSSETVAREVAEQVERYLCHRAAADEYLADQLMVPLATLAGGEFSTGKLSSHAQTNIDTVRAFGVDVRFDAAVGRVCVEPLVRV